MRSQPATLAGRIVSEAASVTLAPASSTRSKDAFDLDKCGALGAIRTRETRFRKQSRRVDLAAVESFPLLSDRFHGRQLRLIATACDPGRDASGMPGDHDEGSPNKGTGAARAQCKDHSEDTGLRLV